MVIANTRAPKRDGNERNQTEEKIVHLASFPELYPGPLLELDQEGKITYLNPATKSIFHDLATLGVSHPFLADWAQVVKQLQDSNWAKSIIREVTVGSLFYEQIILSVAEHRIRIYGRDITRRRQAEEKIEALLKEATRTAEEWQETFDAVTDVVTLAGC